MDEQALEDNFTDPTEFMKNITDPMSWNEDFDVCVILTVLYGMIFLCGILGNSVFCLVLYRNKSLHTATNYYLCSMSLSDVLVLMLSFPYDCLSLWSDSSAFFGETYSVFHLALMETSLNASLLTITVFTVERYVGICHPLRSQTMSQLGRVPKFIVALWVVSLCSAAVVIKVIYFAPDGESNETKFVNSSVVIFFSFFVYFLVPMILITILYILIIRRLKRSEKLMQSNPSSEMESRNKDVIKILVAIVLSFFICYSPIQVQRLLTVVGDTSDVRVLQTGRILTHVSGITLYLSTCVNPIMYHIMSNRFRQAMKKTFSCCSTNMDVRRLSQSSKFQYTSRTSRTTRMSEMPSSVDRTYSTAGSEMDKRKILTKSTRPPTIFSRLVGGNRAQSDPSKRDKCSRHDFPITDADQTVYRNSKAPLVTYIKFKGRHARQFYPKDNLTIPQSRPRTESILSESSISNCSMIQEIDCEEASSPPHEEGDESSVNLTEGFQEVVYLAYHGGQPRSKELKLGRPVPKGVS